MGTGRKHVAKAVLDAAGAGSGLCPRAIPGPCGIRLGIRLDVFKDGGNAVDYGWAMWIITGPWPAGNAI